MTRLLTRLRREESGFTLIELLTAAVIGTVIVGVAFGLLDASVRAFGNSGGRTDAAQRGRISLEVIAQRVRSSVCISSNAPAAPTPNSAFVNAGPDSITFWSDMTGSNFTGARPTTDPPQISNPKPLLRTLTYADGVITEETRGQAGGPVLATRRLATDVQPIDPSTSVFTYWRLADPATPGAPREATTQLPATVPAADTDRIARVRVAFTQRPTAGTSNNSRDASEFSMNIYTRSIDPGVARGPVRCLGV